MQLFTINPAMRFTSLHRCCLVRSAWLVLGVVSFSLLNLSAEQALKITGNPPGATVELDGVPAGTTPLEKNFPGRYFDRMKTAIGQRLEHPMIARVSLQGLGYTRSRSRKAQWIGSIFTGRHHGQYWLFKSDHFQVNLETIAVTFTGAVSAAGAVQLAALGSGDLLTLLRRFYPAIATPQQAQLRAASCLAQTSADSEALATPTAAETSSFVTSSASPESAGFPDYTRTIEIPKARKLTLKAVFQTAGS